MSPERFIDDGLFTDTTRSGEKEEGDCERDYDSDAVLMGKGMNRWNCCFCERCEREEAHEK
ncbi:MAG: hypothetical protein QG606_258 [Patescibacteria group bacterium]|nr:hypothetical protein [Patescibacteria group bacterium]